MNVFGIGLPELAVIAAIGLLVFGPKRLPELGKSLGRTLRGFQSASSEFEKEFRSAMASGDDLAGSTAASLPEPPSPLDSVPAASLSRDIPAEAPSAGSTGRSDSPQA